MKIRTITFTLFVLIFFCLFIFLGTWQLSRAKQKKILLASYAERLEHPPLSIDQLNKSKDPRFYRVSLNGSFDNEHSFLLDNKISHGKVGYEVYTPFKAQGMTQLILVDRGFVAAEKDRNHLPTITNAPDTIITGLLNTAPAYVALGQIIETPAIKWPLRVEYIDLKRLSTLTALSFYPYILSLSPEKNAAYPIEWEIVTVSPERHLGYAIQWFALALTLLILFIAHQRRISHK